MSARVPVVASTAGSIPEVAGDAACSSTLRRRRAGGRARTGRRRRVAAVGARLPRRRSRSPASTGTTPPPAWPTSTMRSPWTRPPTPRWSSPPMIAVLSGGVGAARFLRGLIEVVRPGRGDRHRQHGRRHDPPRSAHLPRPRHRDLHARRRHRSRARLGAGRRDVAGDGVAHPLHAANDRPGRPPAARGSTSATATWPPTSTAPPASPRAPRRPRWPAEIARAWGLGRVAAADDRRPGGDGA